MRNKLDKRFLKVVLLAVGIVLILGLFLLILIEKQTNQYITIDSGETFSQWNDKISYKGQRYHRNNDISPVLFLGIDHADGLPDEIYIGRGGRSDTIYVFLLNKKEKTTTLLSVSRDTMTEVDVYNPEGEYYYSGVMQLTMQYAFGKDAENSCQITEQTISELLYNLSFDSYISVDLEAITAVVDMLGGLTLTMPEDYSYIDPRYKEGNTVTLSSWDVEWLLRYRDEKSLESNDERMERQSMLVQVAAEELKKTDIISLIPDIMKFEKDDITTNAGITTILNLASYQISDKRYSVPGEYKAGAVHAEYYVDPYELMDLLVELLYVPDQ